MSSQSQDYIEKTLRENWRREMEAALLYQSSAQTERDARRREILTKLANIEFEHAKMWEQKMQEIGVDLQSLKHPGPRKTNLTGRALIHEIEAIENGNAAWYQSLRNVISDADFHRILDRIDADEAEHDDIGAMLQPPQAVSKRLKRIWGEERWHRHEGGGWVGDAIYGVNDGLGAIFGIIAGVAGYTASNSQVILVSGFFGALASTLSMGAGAYLATKSENELMESELEQERREIERDPAHEAEELALIYQLKGFSEEDSDRISRQIASDPDLFLQTMAQEELGMHEATKGNPWRSAIFGSISTLVGGLIPLIPFFFMSGLSAMVTAAVVSILAHFIVGALKSTMTVRSWWASGLEMTFVGVIVGVISYALGVFGAGML